MPISYEIGNMQQVRNEAIQFAISMKEKNRWDMYDATIEFLRDYCIDYPDSSEEEIAGYVYDAKQGFAVLYKTYSDSQQAMRVENEGQDKTTNAFAKEYARVMRQWQ